jgi:hypothetical protein
VRRRAGGRAGLRRAAALEAGREIVDHDGRSWREQSHRDGTAGGSADTIHAEPPLELEGATHERRKHF